MGVRGILIEFPQSNTRVTARLLTHLAPKTCEWVWEALERPLENEVWHVHFIGRALTCRYSIPAPTRRIPPENLTITPAAGDILFVNFTEETGRSRGLVAGEAGSELEPTTGPGTYAGLDLFYGPDSRMLIPMGWHAAPVVGQVVENLAGLADVANLTRIEGVKKVRFSRLNL
jgi:hypothetical protein